MEARAESERGRDPWGGPGPAGRNAAAHTASGVTATMSDKPNEQPEPAAPATPSNDDGGTGPASDAGAPGEAAAAPPSQAAPAAAAKPGLTAPAIARDSLRPAEGGRSDAGRSEGPAGRAGEAAEAAPRRGGGWVSFLFALVALVAAFVALTAPALRGHVRSALETHTGLPAPWLELFSGRDDTLMELDRTAFEQRIQQLEQTLERVAAGAAVDSAGVRDVLTGAAERRWIEEQAARVAELGRRLDGYEVRLATQAGATETLAASTDRLAGGQTALGERVTGNAEGLETLKGGLGEVVGRLAAATGRLDTVETGIAETGARLDALDGRLGKVAESLAATQSTLDGVPAQVALVADRVAALAETQSTVTGQVSGMAVAVQQVTSSEEQRTAALTQLRGELNDRRTLQRTLDWPYLAIAELRAATQSSLPFQRQLSLSRGFLGEDPAIAPKLAAISVYSTEGVPTIGDLRQSFAFLAGSVGDRPETRLASWTDRVSGWFTYVFASEPIEATPAGRISSLLASIDAALEAQQLAFAIDEMVNLGALSPNGQIDAWLVQARSRLMVDRTVRELSDIMATRLKEHAG